MIVISSNSGQQKVDYRPKINVREDYLLVYSHAAEDRLSQKVGWAAGHVVLV